MRLLLVEDNAGLAELVKAGLESHDFVVDHCETLDQAIHSRALAAYDLVVLDLGLPDGDGATLVRRLRRDGDPIPILIITARGGLNDRLRGLDSGADDYLVKPFATAELAARCRALLRRPGACLGVLLTLGGIALDTVNRTVRITDQNVNMSSRDVALLEALLRQAGQVVPRERLIDALYSFDNSVTPNALEVAVSRLRKKLDVLRSGVILKTAHGVGYALFDSAQRD